jgi:hypothetical protein
VHTLRRALAAALLVAAALAAPLLSGSAAPARAAGSGSGVCTVDLGGQWITVQCQYGGGTGGAPGGPGGGGHGRKLNLECTLTPIDQGAAQQLGLQWPPPKGFTWAFMDCIGGRVASGPLAVLVSKATGAPAVTPQQLLQQALNDLQIPTLRPSTAPPRGKDALVGLPEWFWVRKPLWHPESVTVSAGPVWATATATPVSMSFQPGGGFGPVSCQGPGAAYNTAKAAGQQHSACAFTYPQPSAGQPGNAYQASVAITWNVSWTGSGGVGGEVDAGLVIQSPFAIQVAQGEALVSNP